MSVTADFNQEDRLKKTGSWRQNLQCALLQPEAKQFVVTNPYKMKYNIFIGTNVVYETD